MKQNQAAGITEADRARAELYDTLGQLRNRLDYAQRIDDTVEKAKQRLDEEKRENPVVFAIAVAGVAAVCGVAVWGIARKVFRSL